MYSRTRIFFLLLFSQLLFTPASAQQRLENFLNSGAESEEVDSLTSIIGNRMFLEFADVCLEYPKVFDNEAELKASGDDFSRRDLLNFLNCRTHIVNVADTIITISSLAKDQNVIFFMCPPENIAEIWKDIESTLKDPPEQIKADWPFAVTTTVVLARKYSCNKE